MVNSKKRKPKHRKNPSATIAKRTILIVILILSIAVIVALISTYFYDNKKIVKSKIVEITRDYYENYFYEQLVGSEQFKQRDNFEEAMEKYHVGGLNPLSLRDLLIYDNKKNSEFEEFLTKYCDKDTTTVRIFPDPPYDRTSYHAEFTYSCNF